MKSILLAVVLLALSCAHTSPTPTAADAGINDLFTGVVFDCHLDIVKVERDGAKPDIARCLQIAGTEETTIENMARMASECLVNQAGQYNPATVACLSRDLGADANASVLAGSNIVVDKTMADNARAFINLHQLGYK